MEAVALDWAREVATTGLARWASGSAYPWINVAHVLGLVLFLGSIAVVDLRVAGAWPRLPAGELTRALTPFAVAGFGVMLVSGALLFAADAPATVASAAFRWKLAAIGLALLNAAAFRSWFADGANKRAAGLMAVASLCLWVTVATLGRMIAYT
ncbi:hypothetical protein [Glacieibacterium frigidum]|uniref:DUF2214 domain-containing protein n=1 Tax=Glacieibacterium frigidum TaxID=2593303 RepID=A0A552UFQ9_9SPHN|nr:hypothetical protein [Glacieibacterium frigidum]TRW17058.1 hypothetical protein FMM06_02285 [Glacieibacterium frigidum]